MSRGKRGVAAPRTQVMRPASELFRWNNLIRVEDFHPKMGKVKARI